jgi:hypothetical protein
MQETASKGARLVPPTKKQNRFGPSFAGATLFSNPFT